MGVCVGMGVCGWVGGCMFGCHVCVGGCRCRFGRMVFVGVSGVCVMCMHICVWVGVGVICLCVYGMCVCPTYVYVV